MKKTIDVQGTKVYLNGEGEKTIVMIHGWPDTHEIWQKQVDFFKKEYTCVTFTLPSFDKEDTKKYTFEDIIIRIKNIVDTICPNSKAILLVHDWGCVFGYEYAMRYPEKIEKLIGIDIGDASSPEFEKSLKLQAKLMMFSYQITLALGWITKSDFIHKIMAKGLQARSNFENIHAGMGLPYAMRWLGVRGGFGKLKTIKPSFPFFYAYALKKPFLFHTEQWINALEQNPKNKIQAFNCSHWVMIDKAEEFNESVNNWLKK
jgi:pimeloyl-ACP methyl ester carboxylesterase